MEKSEQERLKKIKSEKEQIQHDTEELKTMGECIASDDLIDKLSDLKSQAKSKPIAQSEESLKEYQQAMIYAGSITYQLTPDKCKKVKNIPPIPIDDIVAIGKTKGGKCRLLDKTRAVIKKAVSRDEIGVKQNGQPKMVRLTKNHKKGFDDSIEEINKLKKEYDCKYD